jgi:hypothetical protein
MLQMLRSEIQVMAAMQKLSGLIEHWYGEGNFNRTLLLLADYRSTVHTLGYLLARAGLAS